MVIHTTLNFATMTINQIKKQIATAEKNIVKFKANVDRYMTRRDNAIAKANKKGIAITAGDFHIDNADDQYPDVNINDDKRDMYSDNFGIIYPVTNNWQMALQNDYMARRESRRLARLSDELNALVASEKATADAYDKNLETVLSAKMVGFRNAWFEKMRNHFADRFEYVNANKNAARAIYDRLDRIRRRTRYNRNHYWLNARIESGIQSCTRIFCDAAARMTRTDYMAMMEKETENNWNTCVHTLVDRCGKFDIDKEHIETSEPVVTEKGFEIVITDASNRRIYARIIWCAENSVLVTPHTRYIVTSKNI